MTASFYSEQDTIQLAQSLSKIASSGDVFALYGSLGAGKTTFARAFIQALCGSVDVPSPTFTLVQEYPGPLYHFDFYRLKSIEDVEELNFDEALHDGICLIEWPELVQSRLPSDRLDILFSLKDDLHFIDLKAFGSFKAHFSQIL